MGYIHAKADRVPEMVFNGEILPISSIDFGNKE